MAGGVAAETAGSVAASATATTASSANDGHGYRCTNDSHPGHCCCSEAALVTRPTINVTAATPAATSAAMVTRRNFTISTVVHIDKEHYEPVVRWIWNCAAIPT
ncbi:hypothetical protein GCM10010199_47980 [Dactylosporangium roseum]